MTASVTMKLGCHRLNSRAECVFKIRMSIQNIKWKMLRFTIIDHPRSSSTFQVVACTSRGTAVTSACLNVRKPILTILNLDLQCGSGHAISASVDIQSLVCVGRCFAARSGRTDAVCTCERFRCERRDSMTRNIRWRQATYLRNR